jgi:hypothetical protein
MTLWADAASSGAFGAPRKGAGHLEAVERVKDWTRARFGLGNEPIVLTEAAGVLPGFPAHETLVVFWSGEDGRRHHFKVFKRVEDIDPEDIPPAFMKDALAEGEGITCACC